jgi:[ribosomal protein S5]-alanine N-acetyltransferase
MDNQPLPFPTLETERLHLRRLVKDDAPGLLELYSNEDVTRFIDVPTLTELEQAEALVTSMDALYASGKGLRWGVYTLEDCLFIGTCGYHDWDHKRQRAEISYDLGPHSWGQGYMREALLAVLDFGFKTLKLHRIEALVDPADKRSQNLLYGLGFKMEGVLRDHDFLKGRFQDDMVFALLQQDWVKTG